MNISFELEAGPDSSTQLKFLHDNFLLSLTHAEATLSAIISPCNVRKYVKSSTVHCKLKIHNFILRLIHNTIKKDPSRKCCACYCRYFTCKEGQSKAKQRKTGKQAKGRSEKKKKKK